MSSRKLQLLFVALFAAGLVVLRAQTATGPLNTPVPLMPGVSTPAASAGQSALSLSAAQRAQELGMPAVAAGIYQQMLDTAGTEQGTDRAGLTLALATALLDDGRAAEAEKVLNDFVGLRGSAWHLRAGLAALQSKKIDAAKAEQAAVRIEELAKADVAWAYFLEGALFDQPPVPDVSKANDAYHKAEAAATTDIARTRFQVAEERVRLAQEKPSDKVLTETRANFDRLRGTAVGYGIARDYAAMLDKAGRSSDAVKFLQADVLLRLPQSERARWDDFRFMLGLIDNRGRGEVGRRALIQLLETGSDAEKQREGLQVLSDASQAEPARGQFRAELLKLTSATPPHPLRETLLLFSAQMALVDRDYRQAENDGSTLLKEFPGSPLRVYAYGVLTLSAWDQSRYRLAATYARQARAELANPPTPELGEARAWLGVLEAEASFRAGDVDDFRNAADTYAAVLRERPPGVSAGDLMFQRVLAEIKSGSANAAAVLDEVEDNPAFDPNNRWQAEWNLARELRTHLPDGVKQAYARVNKLLGAEANAAAIAPDLQARMAWLQARLALEAGEPEHALTFVDGLAKSVATVDAALRNEITGTGLLLKAQAQITLKVDASETLKRLREDPDLKKSDAAAASYLVEADHDVEPGVDRIVDAQKLLTQLAEKFPENRRYAPYALFRAAVLAERLGQDDNYREANRLIEDLVSKYPQSELVFPARLKQGELLEKLNQLALAQRVYQDLENNFPRHKDVVRAQLALAECMNAQASGNSSYLTNAQAKFEQLLFRVDAEAEVRIEAGYNLGELLARRDNPEKAIEVWWKDVVSVFLLDLDMRKKLLLEKEEGAKSRYWIARTLERVGELLEQQGKFEDAKRAWSLMIETKLGFDSLAQRNLARVGVAEAKP